MIRVKIRFLIGFTPPIVVSLFSCLLFLISCNSSSQVETSSEILLTSLSRSGMGVITSDGKEILPATFSYISIPRLDGDKIYAIKSDSVFLYCYSRSQHNCLKLPGSSMLVSDYKNDKIDCDIKTNRSLFSSTTSTCDTTKVYVDSLDGVVSIVLCRDKIVYIVKGVNTFEMPFVAHSFSDYSKDVRNNSIEYKDSLVMYRNMIMYSGAFLLHDFRKDQSTISDYANCIPFFEL